MQSCFDKLAQCQMFEPYAVDLCFGVLLRAEFRDRLRLFNRLFEDLRYFQVSGPRSAEIVPTVVQSSSPRCGDTAAMPAGIRMIGSRPKGD
jgi:hypothetical protein